MLMRHLLFATLVSTAVLGCSPSPTIYGTAKPVAPAPVPTPPKPAPAAPVPRPTATATATLRDLAGARVGTVTLTDAYGGVMSRETSPDSELGAHAIHIHEIGKV